MHGELSEPELLIPYGTSRFCCKAGLLEGNPVLTFDGSLSALPELGRRALWSGGMRFRIGSSHTPLSGLTPGFGAADSFKRGAQACGMISGRGDSFV